MMEEWTHLANVKRGASLPVALTNDSKRFSGRCHYNIVWDLTTLIIWHADFRLNLLTPYLRGKSGQGRERQKGVNKANAALIQSSSCCNNPTSSRTHMRSDTSKTKV